MKLRNQIVNYFVVSCDGIPPRVVRSPVTIGSEIAKVLIEKQFKSEGLPSLNYNAVLHVCYDYDSKMIYVPNSRQFSKETVDGLLAVAKYRIEKDFGGCLMRPPIEGSPFSSIRVRSLNSFSHANAIVKKYKSDVENIPVIEANLARMPSTLKTLPREFQDFEELVGNYISPSFSGSISFIDEIEINGKKRENPVFLLNQKTPFILINIAKTSKRDEPTANEKEWVVLSGYRDYLFDSHSIEKEKDGVNHGVEEFADMYAIRRHLYLGWSFEEVCFLFMGSANDFGELLKATDRLVKASDSLEKEGYKNPSSIPYYMTFKIDEQFPLGFSHLINYDGKINVESQYQNMIVLDFDPKTNYIIIKTPVYITQELCERVFKPQSKPFICRYNSIVKKIDVKGDSRTYEDIKRNNIQLGKIFSFIKNDVGEDKSDILGFRTGKLASGDSAMDPNIYNVRKISDYLYASDFIKKMCKRYEVKFVDFEVVVGPIEKAFGAGVQGGYMDKELFCKNKWTIPKELAEGVFISPPIIFVNSVTNPSYASQTDTLIHEYRRYIYGVQNPNYQITYKSPKNSRDYQAWYLYLQDRNEQAAHKDQIKFELGLGKSYDEIIRDKVGGKITTDNYPIALKFSELVQDAVEEIEGEEKNHEESIG